MAFVIFLLTHLGARNVFPAQVPTDSERDALESVPSDDGGEEEVQEEEEAQPQKKVKLNYGSKATLSSRAI